MFKVASWFKPRPSSEGREAVALVTPFIVALDLETDRVHPGTEADPVLGARAFEPVLAALQPRLTQLFVRLPRAFPLPDWIEWLAVLESPKLQYHLETQLPWEAPAALLGRFHALERLDRLRIRVDGFGDLVTGPSAALIRRVLDAGLNLWAILPLAAAGGADLEGQVARGQAMGLRGMSFRWPEHPAPPPPEALLAGLAGVYQRGYPVFVEGCLPLERPPVIRGLDSDCTRQEGVCLVDGAARVWTCPHAAAPAGSLLGASLDSLWAALPHPDAGGPPGQAGPAIHLDESLRPLLQCDLRKEASGALLIRGYTFMPVTEQGLDAVRAFNGQRNLHELQDRFGREATVLALALFQRGMLRFVQPDDDHA